MAAQSASKKIGQKKLEIRRQKWPEITDEMLWHRKTKKGFTTIPRTMTYVTQIMNNLSPNIRVSETYLTLWCHTFDEYLVVIENPIMMAFEAGFTTQRGVATWKKRMQRLVELGFIEAKEGISGPYHYVLILNPFTAIKNLREANKLETIEDNKIIDALRERLMKIGAEDKI